MKFLQVARAPEGLTSYARVRRFRPVHGLITVIEAVLSLLGVVILVLAFHYGSFERAGTAIDWALGKVTGLCASLSSQPQK